MSYQNIDASLSVADIQAIKDAFTAILTKLPFLVNLTVDERRKVFKTGPDRLSFVKNALTGAVANPDIFPNSLSVPAFQRDVDLLDALSQLKALADSLASQIDDTRLAVGGEAMQEATQVYNYVKEAAKTTPGLKPLADQLGEQFQRAGRAKPPEPPKP